MIYPVGNNLVDSSAKSVKEAGSSSYCPSISKCFAKLAGLFADSPAVPLKNRFDFKDEWQRLRAGILVGKKLIEDPSISLLERIRSATEYVADEGDNGLLREVRATYSRPKALWLEDIEKIRQFGNSQFLSAILCNQVSVIKTRSQPLSDLDLFFGIYYSSFCGNVEMIETLCAYPALSLFQPDEIRPLLESSLKISQDRDHTACSTCLQIAIEAGI